MSPSRTRIYCRHCNLLIIECLLMQISELRRNWSRHWPRDDTWFRRQRYNLFENSLTCNIVLTALSYVFPVEIYDYILEPVKGKMKYG